MSLKFRVNEIPAKPRLNCQVFYTSVTVQDIVGTREVRG